MTAFYNEIDPYCAQWLRNLIDADLIAPGVVDERSIEDIRPSELDGYAQCHFFAGIGVWSYALRLAGVADSEPVWTGSCPCQPFSSAGKRKGFEDARHLWPAWFNLIRERRPARILGEQVARGGGFEWLDVVQTDLEEQDYAVAAASLCAAGFGANHVRDRIFFVANAHSDCNGLEALPYETRLLLATDDSRSARRFGQMGSSAVWSQPRPSGARAVAMGDEPSRGLGQLRAYGNAIAAPVAIEFIKAALTAKP